MKSISKLIVLFLCALSLTACENDEGKLPDISFKTGGNYISSNTTLQTGSSILIGINASKTEDKDVLKKFNITKIVDEQAEVTVFSKDLSGSEGNTYSYDFSATLEETSGQNVKYIFTVVNRDGLVNQVSLTIVVQ